MAELVELERGVDVADEGEVLVAAVTRVAEALERLLVAAGAIAGLLVIIAVALLST